MWDRKAIWGRKRKGKKEKKTSKSSLFPQFPFLSPVQCSHKYHWFCLQIMSLVCLPFPLTLPPLCTTSQTPTRTLPPDHPPPSFRLLPICSPHPVRAISPKHKPWHPPHLKPFNSFSPLEFSHLTALCDPAPAVLPPTWSFSHIHQPHSLLSVLSSPTLFPVLGLCRSYCLCCPN